MFMRNHWWASRRVLNVDSGPLRMCISFGGGSTKALHPNIHTQSIWLGYHGTWGQGRNIYTIYIYMKYMTVNKEEYPEHFVRGIKKKPANVAYIR